MRPPSFRRWLAGLVVLAGAAACACPPAARLLAERPDFRTPEAAARSFLAAVSCDDPAAEYRCLAESFKAEHGATLDAWMIGRVEARREIGGFLLGRASSLRFLGAEPDALEAHGILTRWGLGERARLGLVFVPQNYFDLDGPDGPIGGSLLEQPPSAYLSQRDRSLLLELPDVLPGRFPDLAGATRLELGTEWKLRRLILLDPSP